MLLEILQPEIFSPDENKSMIGQWIIFIGITLKFHCCYVQNLRVFQVIRSGTERRRGQNTLHYCFKEDF